MNDLRFAFRLLAKSPTFTLAAVLTLALGIGANTAIFTVVNGILLRPLPYPAPQELVTFRAQQSVLELNDIAEQSRSFSGIGGIGLQATDFSGGGEPMQLEVGLVAGDFFSVLGTRPALGRVLAAEDNRFGAGRSLVLSHAFWQRQFGGDASVLGRTITLAGQSYDVIGVTSADFRSPHGTPDAFASLPVFYPEAAKSRGAHLLRVYGRLRPAVSMAEAKTEQRVIDDRLARTSPEENKGRASVLVSLHERLVGDIRPALLLLFGAVGMVLLIACANFANLLLARNAARAHELSIRAALGASRAQLIRQVLSESLLRALLGGLAGLLLGSWGVDALLALKPEDLPRVENIQLDAGVMAFTLGLALLTGLLFGLLPAWQATRVNLNGMIGLGTPRLTSGPSALRSALVVIELALALILLVGASLFGRTFLRLTNANPGFRPQQLLTLRVELPEARYQDVARQTQFREQVLDRMNTVPGVQAAMVSELPLGGNAIDHNFLIEGQPLLPAGDEPSLYNRSVAGDYFRVMGIPLRQGRSLTREDRSETPTVGVVNEAMARQYFSDQSPLGKRLRWARNEGVDWITIVGVVGDVRHFGLGRMDEAAIYTLYAQSGQEWKRWSEFVVRADGAAQGAALIAQLKGELWKVDPLIPVSKVRSMSEVLAVSLSERRFNALLIGVFALVALSLSAIGLYGVIAYLVEQRTREIGVRMALGAQRHQVLGLIMRHGLVLGLLGLALGMAGALMVGRLLTSFLIGVGPTDLASLGTISLVLLGVVVVASYLPARRAAALNPNLALRHD
ncbi:MAG: ABC transporter permease [Chthoniobacterales bacterium]